MIIWALDLGSKVGVAMGAPPTDLSKLKSFTVLLRQNKEEDVYDLSLNFRAFLDEAIEEATAMQERPNMLCYEAPMDPNWQPRDGRGRNAAALLLPPLLVGRIRDLGRDEDIATRMVWPATIRSRFLGKQNAGDRKLTKEAMVARAKEWGYLPESSKDNDRADAIGLWHISQCHYGGWVPPFDLICGQRVLPLRGVTA